MVCIIKKWKIQDSSKLTLIDSKGNIFINPNNKYIMKLNFQILTKVFAKGEVRPKI